jgi:hypothetical protein
MGVKVAKDASDLGIVTTRGPAMLALYRDVLDFVHAGDSALEHVGIAAHVSLGACPKKLPLSHR